MIAWIAGGFMTLALVLSDLKLFGLTTDYLWTGLCFWLATILLWPQLANASKKQALALATVGITGILWGLHRGYTPDWHWALTANAPILSMLIAISFLSLVADQGDPSQALPKGWRALASTVLGMNLFAAVINFSMVILTADRLQQQNGPLQNSQLRAISRSFANAAFWSPFFIAMAVALTYAPGARWESIVLPGVCMALLGACLTLWDLRHDAKNFVGYPIQLHSLWLPGALALLIIIGRFYFPDASVVGLITLLAPLLSLLMLVWQRRQRHRIVLHIRDRLPQSRQELSLFLSAGVMGAGLSSVINSENIVLPFTQFDALAATVLLVIMILFAAIGVHPVISIAALSTLLAPIEPDPLLLALMFLSAWALGPISSPFSGIGLALKSRYNVSGRRLVRLNIGYSLRMAMLCGCIFWWLDS